mmetsp:Transcript_283/g.508  ORF Transcript_283/g.508 Transcript_283/m.508 type:complete len:221 (-) Transcript_283:553-1215(-)
MGSAADSLSSMWIFGYGSLIWKPDFEFVESIDGYLRGYVRRFYQGSNDHRGTSEYPGLVVTLVPGIDEGLREEDAFVWGRAFRIDPGHADGILQKLDIREQNGYEVIIRDVYDKSHQIVAHNCMVYVANKHNPSWRGGEKFELMAERILRAAGISGPNFEYVANLYRALEQMKVEDKHVEDLYLTLLEARNQREIHRNTPLMLSDDTQMELVDESETVRA